MALMPAMPITSPTKEDIAFDKHVRELLLLYDDLAQCVAEVPKIKALDREAEQMSGQIKKDKESLLERCERLGSWFLRAKELVKECHGHGHWQKWLEQNGFAERTAQLYMAIVRNPAILAKSGYDLSKVRVKPQAVAVLAGSESGEAKSSSVSGEAKERPFSVATVIHLIDKLDALIESNGEELKNDSGFLSSLNVHHAKLHRLLGLCPECTDAPKLENGICPNCGVTEAEITAKEQAEEQRKIEEEQVELDQQAQRQALVSHPAWTWVTKLVINGGDGHGEPRPDSQVKKKHGFGYDEIAQELGYERGEVPGVGKQPDHVRAPDEQFKSDLKALFRQGITLGLIKARATKATGRHIGGLRRKGGLTRKPSRASVRAKIVSGWEQLDKPIVYFRDGTASDDLNLVPTPKLMEIAKLIEKGTVANVNGTRILIAAREEPTVTQVPLALRDETGDPHGAEPPEM